MITPSFITQHQFTKKRILCGLTQERIQLTTSNGKTYNIRAEARIRLPSWIKDCFWTKVTFDDLSTVYINKNSLAKRTQVSGYYVKGLLKTQATHFDNLICRLSRIVDISAVLVQEEYLGPLEARTTSIEFVDRIEQNRVQYLQWAEKGYFVEEWNKRTIIVRTHEGIGEFYLSLQSSLGSGGFKEVHALLDYETARSDLALSRFTKKFFPHSIKLTQQLEESQWVMPIKFYIENFDGKAYLVNERYMGTFKDIAADLLIPFKTKLTLFSHIVKGVLDMHKQEIVHRDIKAENVLYLKTKEGYKIKLIDLDVSCYFNNEDALSYRSGTRTHMPPEVLSRQKVEHPAKIDAWSLGITLYRLCENKPKFTQGLKQLSTEAKVSQVLEGVKELKFEKLPSNSPLIPLIKGLLDPNPASRMSPEQALKDLEAIIQEMNPVL